MDDLTPYEQVCQDNQELRAKLQLAEEKAFYQAAEIAHLKSLVEILKRQ